MAAAGAASQQPHASTSNDVPPAAPPSWPPTRAERELKGLDTLLQDEILDEAGADKQRASIKSNLLRWTQMQLSGSGACAMVPTEAVEQAASGGRLKTDYKLITAEEHELLKNALRRALQPRYALLG
jgi:hypothetical protein